MFVRACVDVTCDITHFGVSCLYFVDDNIIINNFCLGVDNWSCRQSEILVCIVLLFIAILEPLRTWEERNINE